MPKILTFPHQTGWTPPYPKVNLPALQTIHLVLALDPPTQMLQKVYEAQQDIQKRYQKQEKTLLWTDPRDIILPVVEIPEVRSEAVNAVFSRMRQGAKGLRYGNLTAKGIEGASSGKTRLWVKIEDEERLWQTLRSRVTKALSQDGFSFIPDLTPKLVLAKETPDDQSAPDPSSCIETWRSFDFGVFVGWDFVLYWYHPEAKEVSLEVLTYLPLDNS